MEKNSRVHDLKWYREEKAVILFASALWHLAACMELLRIDLWDFVCAPVHERTCANVEMDTNEQPYVMWTDVFSNHDIKLEFQMKNFVPVSLWKS